VDRGRDRTGVGLVAEAYPGRRRSPRGTGVQRGIRPSTSSGVEGATVTHVRRRNGERATLSKAQQAFFDGAFEACLTACDGIVVRDEPMRFEIALLRGRVLLRLDRAQETIEALRACAYTPTSLDGLLTAEMLLGAAYARLAQQKRGEAMLANALARADGAHPTVRAELTLNLGIARYWLGRHDEADALLAAVPEDADIVRARALEYRGWIEFSRGRFDASAAWFRAALFCIENCRRHDRFVEANSLQGLATLCAELLETNGWDAVERRVAAFDWSADGIGRPRFWVSLYCSMMREVLGDETGARESARRAEEQAPNLAYRAIALCRIAGVFRGLRESTGHLEFTIRAKEAYETLDARNLAPDQRLLPLSIAEELAHARAHSEAARLMAQYREQSATVPEVPGDDRFLALEHVVEATICESRGERNAAVRHLSIAFALFRKACYRRRACAIALRLARLTGASRYVRFAAAALRDADPRYWMALEVARLQDGTSPALTDNQRTILVLVAQGKTYKEIGATLGRSWKTVNNSVEQLRAKFGAGTRGELVAEAMRRGVVDLGTAARRSESA
jgi:DNA-binding CsgD family transcriptional regulator